MSRKVLFITGAIMVASLFTMAQEERMPYGPNSFYKNNDQIDLTKKQRKASTSEVLFEENFDSYETNFDENKWDVFRSADIDGTDLAEANSPKWFLCKPTNFAGNGATYINSGTRSAAIAYTAPNFTWLTTKEAVTITSNEVALGFCLYFYNNTTQGISTNFHVLVQEDGANNWSLLNSWNQESTNNLFEKRVIVSLSNYFEKSIRIAFVYENQDDNGYQPFLLVSYYNNNNNKKIF